MKSLLSISLLAILFLNLLLTSCKKDKTKTPFEILTSKQWIQTKFEIDNKDSNWETFNYGLCGADDITTFDANGIYTFDRGEIKCESNEQNFTGTWSLSADGNALMLDGDLLSVNKLTDTQLVIEFDNLSPTGIDYRTTYVAK